MQGFADFHVAGTLGGDPELMVLDNGTDRMTISVAVNRRVKNAREEWEDKTVWMKFAMFGKRARPLADMLRKGDCVIVRGDISSWIDNSSGKNRTMYNFKANEILSPHFKKGRDASEGRRELDGEGARRRAAPPAAAAPEPAPEPPMNDSGDIDPDDLPFA